ncbi:MAG: ribosome recycling factor [Bacteroidetes bacterium]|nr:ribosome recycling factor [Bacteroidota bacterium]
MIELKTLFAEAETKMNKVINHFESNLLNIRAGKASVTMLNGITAESYGSMMPIDQIASITVPDSKSIVIQPWDKKAITAIEKAILNANIGVTPSNNGENIRINLPPLTEERRRELAKQVKTESEGTKISIRNARRDAIETIKKGKKDGLAEDAIKDGENEIQKMTDKFTKKIEAMVAAKEKEIMAV